MKSVRGLFYAILSSGTFGLIGFFTVPLQHDGMNNLSILFYRFLFSTLIMGLICLLRRESLKVARENIKSLLFLGFMYAFTAYFFIRSYEYLGTGLTTIIHFMYPIMVAAIMIFIFKEQKSNMVFISAFLSVSGVIVLSWPDGIHQINYWGLLVAGVTIVTYATYIVGVNKSKAGRIDTEVLTFYILLVGASVFGLLALFSKGGLQGIHSTPQLVRLFSLAFVCTVVSDFTLILAIKLVGSTITSILGSMEPLVAVAVGVLYFDEPFGIKNVIGLILIIFAVVMVILSTAKKKDPEEIIEEKLL